MNQKKIYWHRMNSNEIKWTNCDYFTPGETEWIEVISNEINFNQNYIKWNQMKSNEIKSNQVKSIEIKWN